MPKQLDHISQAKTNLQFLQEINKKIDGFYDWKVTVCFYTAVHLVNSHLSNFDLQYRSHADVNYALNPETRLSLSKLHEDEFVAYVSLQSLSRRSRYLVNEKDSKLRTDQNFITYEKHYAKALRHLDKLLKFFTSKYKFEIQPIQVQCSYLSSNDKLKYLHII